jgi:Asp-tRNA(Asn)/Glu-tRNA(Gln) amidotransferase A subunit family amidase
MTVLSIEQSAANLRARKTTARALLDACWANFDRYEPKVKAWVFVDREGALAEADRLDSELKAGHYRGPLHGIPIGIKDIFDVFDWPTAAGSKRWAQSYARQDASVVRKLREAGAILLGKTVTTAYASFDPPPTRNPWNLTKTPGGSSSGSAAAVACGMCLGALGSQTGGSITRPASFCGVAGCKPTYGRVSTFGVVPLAESMDHVGPIARTVNDLAILLQVIAGSDPNDLQCHQKPLLRLDSELTDPPELVRLRGLFEDQAEPATLALMDEVEKRLRNAGGTIKEVTLPRAFAEVNTRHRCVMAVEAAAYHETRFRRHPEDYPPCITSLLREGLACSAAEYQHTKAHQQRLAHEMMDCFNAGSVWLTPATRGPAPGAETTGDPAFNSPWSYTGFPTVSVPTGRFVDGLPLAIQLIGRPWEEGTLFAVAQWCERVLQAEMQLPPG